MTQLCKECKHHYIVHKQYIVQEEDYYCKKVITYTSPVHGGSKHKTCKEVRAGWSAAHDGNCPNYEKDIPEPTDLERFITNTIAQVFRRKQ